MNARSRIIGRCEQVSMRVHNGGWRPTSEAGQQEWKRVGARLFERSVWRWFSQWRRGI